MNKTIDTAIIIVGGWGTRWLPLTKAVEKSMIPVGTRPVADWIVADCVRAGIQRIIFVIGEEHEQLQQYFSHHASLERYLTEQNKHEMLELVRQPQYANIHFEYVVQPNNGHYGTAMAVALAIPKLTAGESALVLNGDDFIFRTDSESETADFIKAWQESPAPHAFMADGRVVAEATRYGVIYLDERGQGKAIVEKPPLEQLAGQETVPINLGKYIFGPAVFEYIARYVGQGQTEKEYFITTPINQAAAAGERYLVHMIHGQHLDAGNPKGWLHANQVVSQVL